MTKYSLNIKMIINNYLYFEENYNYNLYILYKQDLQK